jgi:hypothetical protein
MSNEYPARTPDAAASTVRGHVAKNLATIIAVIMVLLAMVGTGIALADVTWARNYWLMLVPIYGLLCIFAAWYHARAIDQMVIRQILHWISVGVAIALDFIFLRGSGEQTATATGLNSLLILALGCLLAGIHMEWLFALVGLLLLAIVVIVSIAQEYLALVFVAGAFVIMLVLAGRWVRKKWIA